MNDLLTHYNQFQECLLLDIRWLRYGFTLELVFDYIWQAPGILRPNLDAEERVLVTLQAVQEMHIVNDWADENLERPEDIPWGVSEIAIMYVEHNSPLIAKYQTPLPQYHHLILAWESDRRIEIVCGEIHIRRMANEDR